MAQINFGIIFVFIGFFNCGLALKCWTCSSDLDISCMDHFNTTKLLQHRSYYQNINTNSQYQSRNDMPALVECNNNLGQIYGQKQICMKKVMSVPNGREIITRECKSVSSQQAIGNCPDEPVPRGSSRIFCQYCDYDGCNSGTSLTTNMFLVALVPISLLILFRK